MNNIKAIEIAQDYGEGIYSEKQFFQAWQHLVDSGLAWSLEGWFGRRAYELIQAGHINPPKESSHR